MATPAEKSVRQTYVVEDEGFFYGSWRKKGDTLALFPIQAEHYVGNARLRPATEADVSVKSAKPTKPLVDPVKSAPKRPGSANDPG